MSAARVPVVLGLGPGVGAATVAAALHAHASSATDVGPTYGMAGSLAADIAVCSGSEVSLQWAEALRGAPVVVIVLVDDRPPPSRSRQRQLGLRHRAVVVLPHVAHWAGLSAVPDEAAFLLAHIPERLPRTLRDYGGALRLVVTALMRGGSLREPQPPRLTWSAGPPAPRTTPARPAPPQATPIRTAPPKITSPRAGAVSRAESALDDDALEAQAITISEAAGPGPGPRSGTAR